MKRFSIHILQGMLPFLFLTLLPVLETTARERALTIVTLYEGESPPPGLEEALLKELGIKRKTEGINLIDDEEFYSFLGENTGFTFPIIRVCTELKPAIHDIFDSIQEGENTYAFMDWSKSFKIFKETLSQAFCAEEIIPQETLLKIYLYLVQTAHYTGDIAERDNGLRYLLTIRSLEEVSSKLPESLQESLNYIHEKMGVEEPGTVPARIATAGGELFMDGMKMAEGEMSLAPGDHLLELRQDGKGVNMMVNLTARKPAHLNLAFLLQAGEKGLPLSTLFPAYLKGEKDLPILSDSTLGFLESQGVEHLILLVPSTGQGRLKVPFMGEIYHFDPVKFTRGKTGYERVEKGWIRNYLRSGKAGKIKFLLSGGLSTAYRENDLIIPLLLDLSVFLLPNISISLEGGFSKFYDSDEYYIPSSLSANYYFLAGPLRPMAGVAFTLSYYDRNILIGGEGRGGVLYYLTEGEGMRYFIQSTLGAGYNTSLEVKLLLLGGVEF